MEKNLKHFGAFVLLSVCWLTSSLVASTGEVTVTSVAAKQRYPWNGLVDITVTMQGDEGDIAAAMIPFYATNKTTRAEFSAPGWERVNEAWGREA